MSSFNDFNDFEYGQGNNKKNNTGKGGYFATGLVGVFVGSLITVAMLMSFKGQFKNFASNSVDEQGRVVKIINEEENAIVAIAEKVSPSIVGVRVTYNLTAPSFFGIITQEAEGVGSGIIVRKDGYILTNYHVIEDAYSSTQGKQTAKVEIYLPNSKEGIEARIVGGDEEKDVAVLKIEKDDLVAAELGDSSAVKTGEIAVAIGNPLMLQFAGTVTQGVISAANRKVEIEKGRTINLIQTDAAINSGNSGGALVNGRGQVIGINTVKIVSSGVEGIGFAIPINDVKDIMEKLIDGYVPTDSSEPQIGIGGVAIDEEKSQEYNLPIGVYVGKIYANSAAEDSDIKIGDVITKVEGKDVKTVEEINAIKNQHKIGDKLDITLVRNGKEKTIKLTLKEESYY